MLFRNEYQSSEKNESLLHPNSNFKNVGLSSYKIYDNKIIIMKTYLNKPI